MLSIRALMLLLYHFLNNFPASLPWYRCEILPFSFSTTLCSICFPFVSSESLLSFDQSSFDLLAGARRVVQVRILLWVLALNQIPSSGFSAWQFTCHVRSSLKHQTLEISVLDSTNRVSISLPVSFHLRPPRLIHLMDVSPNSRSLHLVSVDLLLLILCLCPVSCRPFGVGNLLFWFYQTFRSHYALSNQKFREYWLRAQHLDHSSLPNSFRHWKACDKTSTQLLIFHRTIYSQSSHFRPFRIFSLILTALFICNWPCTRIGFRHGVLVAGFSSTVVTGIPSKWKIARDCWRNQIVFVQSFASCS